MAKRRQLPATTPEGRENQLIAKAINLAEKQLEDGTASAQVISHFLRLGSTRERLEQAKMEHEVELMRTRREQIESQQKVEELYLQALNAMRSYSGQAPPHEGYEFDD